MTPLSRASPARVQNQLNPSALTLFAFTLVSCILLDASNIPCKAKAERRAWLTTIDQAGPEGPPKKVTPTPLFRIASVSKPITSVAIFLLLEQNKAHG
jgi:Beta-lactamase